MGLSAIIHNVYVNNFNIVLMLGKKKYNNNSYIFRYSSVTISGYVNSIVFQVY